MSAGTMKAVVIKGPFDVKVEDRPIPQIKDDTDVIVKVTMSALCGSDLHVYRGHQPLSRWDFIAGHELVGTVHELGSAVKNLKAGDKVISPFTTHCGSCFYCERGLTARCVSSALFGSPDLDGGQAEYVRVPLADSTLLKAPPDVAEDHLFLLCDILPTGYFCAKNAWNMLNDIEKTKSTTSVIFGCGPVGLCAITAAAERFTHVYAVDSVPERLLQARAHGAGRLIDLSLGAEAALKQIRDATAGRGADVALEVVGTPEALQLAMDAVRVGGAVASQGLYTQKFELDGTKLYNKNLKLQFGRCPVAPLIPEVLQLLKRNVKYHPWLFREFIKARVTLSEAPEYYKLFNERKVGKVVFVGP